MNQVKDRASNKVMEQEIRTRRQVIDAHVHLFPNKIADKAKDYVGSFYGLPMYTCGTIQELNNTLEAGERKGGERKEEPKGGVYKGADTADEGRWKIVKKLVCSPASRPDQTESINTFIGNMVKDDRSMIGFGTLHRDYENYEAELDRIVELGLKGVKFHFDFQKFNIDDEKMYPVYRAIAERKLPVLFHMGDEKYSYSSPQRLKRVLSEIPELVVIAAHMGGYQHWEEAYDLPVSDRLYFDLSSTLGFITEQDLKRMLDKFGVTHFFFGSDFPMWNPYSELKKLEQMGLTDEELKRIEYCNFIEFMELMSYNK